jgi:hypothetical protein
MASTRAAKEDSPRKVLILDQFRELEDSEWKECACCGPTTMAMTVTVSRNQCCWLSLHLHLAHYRRKGMEREERHLCPVRYILRILE